MTPIEALDILEEFVDQHGGVRRVGLMEAVRTLDRLRQEKNSLGTMLTLGAISGRFTKGGAHA